MMSPHRWRNAIPHRMMVTAFVGGMIIGILLTLIWVGGLNVR